MAKTNDTDNSNNYEKYLQSVKLRGYSNLKPTLTQQTIDEAIAEGEELLKKEAKAGKTSPAPTVINKKLDTGSKNPYKRAHDYLLSQMDQKKRDLYMKMEATGDTKCQMYDNFVEEITKLGDKYSSEDKQSK